MVPSFSYRGKDMAQPLRQLSICKAPHSGHSEADIERP